LGTGSLTVAGTGFGYGQIAADAAEAIASSEKVLYLVPDAETDEWLRAANRGLSFTIYIASMASTDPLPTPE
jgi:hypothetical protein